LDSTIPTSIGNALNLTHLDLTGNYLEGTISSEIGSLSNLKYLFLSENRFTSGPVPTWLENLSNLQDLSLKETGLTGTIPSFMMAMTNLVLMDLEKNKLVGSIPERKIGSGVPQLRFILLNRNELTGSIPDDFSRLSTLDMLMLDHNNITGDMSEVCGLDIRPRIVTADCEGATPEVKCDCCSTCCASEDVECNSESHLGNIDPIWENSFVRKFYEFGPSITFDGTARR
jgi:Leucine-rich repeat (LRR) protein